MIAAPSSRYRVRRKGRDVNSDGCLLSESQEQKPEIGSSVSDSQRSAPHSSIEQNQDGGERKCKGGTHLQHVSPEGEEEVDLMCDAASEPLTR